MAIHFADIWESVARALPEKPALADLGDGKGKTKHASWREYEDRAARLAQALLAQGIQAHDKVGLYTYNRAEHLVAQFACYKLRAIPFNVNYRYLEDELVYLLDNAEAKGIVFEGTFAPRLAAILSKLPKLKVMIEIADGEGHLPGALDYESLIRERAPLPPIARSEEDTYMLYTGGTTGLPKGVGYPMGVITRNMLRGYEFMGVPIPQSSEELGQRVKEFAESGMLRVSLPACPLMHGTGMWGGVYMPHNMGGSVVLFKNRPFDPHLLWRAVEQEKVTDIAIVGDAFAKPMVKALDEAKASGRPYDISSLERIVSSGVMWSAETKERLLEYGALTLMDGMGSTEGVMGFQITTRDYRPKTGTFFLLPTAKILKDNDEEARPGEVGMIAITEGLPKGYYKDEKKTGMTFRTIGGVRYGFPGDYARVEEDGSIFLLGRGSVCINTGGEKVFPEEVEEAIKTHPLVEDCLVTGVPDEALGERVAAVVAHTPGHPVSEKELQAHVHGRLAGYKAPKHVIFVEHIMRGPNGKGDYKWARETAREIIALEEAKPH